MYEKPEERSSESEPVQYGHHCGAGQLTTYDGHDLGDGTRRFTA
jgi:hypothetical protein